MSITNAVLQNWPLNRDNFLKQKREIIFLDPFFLCNFIGPETWDNDFLREKKYLNQLCLIPIVIMLIPYTIFITILQ